MARDEPPVHALRTRLLADAALLGATVVWGTTFVVVRDGLIESSPFVFVALRFTLAAAVLAPFVLARRGLPDARALQAGAIVGGWLFLGFALQTLGLARTEPARAAFLTGLAVVLVPLLLVLLYRKVPTPASLVGVALAAAGLAVMTGWGGGGLSAGDLLVVGCALAFAFQVIAVDRHAREVGPARLLLVELAVAAALAWPAALLAETPRLPITFEGWRPVLVTSLLATLACLLAQNWSQKRIPPTRAGVIFTLEPVCAAIWSYLATGERFGRAAATGSALILAGMLAAELLPGARDPSG